MRLVSVGEIVSCEGWLSAGGDREPYREGSCITNATDCIYTEYSLPNELMALRRVSKQELSKTTFPIVLTMTPD